MRWSEAPRGDPAGKGATGGSAPDPDGGRGKAMARRSRMKAATIAWAGERGGTRTTLQGSQTREEWKVKLFIDTADVEEIRKAMAMGLIDGVTTNPTLISRTGKPARQCFEEICELVPGPVSAEVLATDVDGMVEQGRRLAEIADNIVIKVPMGPEGLQAVRRFNELEIQTNVTLVFNASQALLAAKAGATYVSPFIGRLDDISDAGMDLIEHVMNIFWNYEFDTEVIVASVRHPMHVVEAALIGADIATVPYSVLERLTRHPLTDIGLERFLADAEKIPGEYI